MESKLSRRTANRFLFLILLIGALLRIAGLSFGLPELNHADEPIVVNHALAYGLGDFNPHFFKIPPLTSYLLFLVYGFYFLFGFIFGSFSNTHDFLDLFLRDPSSFYILGRFFIGVMFGIASIAMMYRLIRLIMTREIALLGSLLLAVLFLPVQISHFIYPDSPLLFTLIVCLYFYLRIALNGKFRDYALALIMTGAAIALKYNAALLAAPFLTAHFLRSALRSKKSVIWNYFIVPWLCFFSVVLAFFILNPFFFLDFRFAWQDLIAQSQATGYVGWFHHLNYSLREGVGAPLLLFFIISLFLCLLLIKKRPYLLIFYAYTAVFYLHLVFAAQSYGRYGILLVPPVILFSVLTLNLIYEKRNKIIVPLVVTVVLAIWPFYQSVLLGTILSRQDTRNIAKNWFLENAPKDSKVFFDIDRFQPRLPYCNEDLYTALSSVDPDSPQAKRIRSLIEIQGDQNCFRVYYRQAEPGAKESQFSLRGRRTPLDWEKFDEENIRYFGLTRLKSEYPDEKLIKELNENGKLVARISPYKNPDQNFSTDSIDLTGAPTTIKDLIGRNRNGHLIEIYELRD